MKKIILILMAVLVPSVALANFSITLENTFNKKMYYLVYWIDHPYKWRGPANMAGGELNALESVTMVTEYKSGKYYVIWRDDAEWQNRIPFDIGSHINTVIINPETISF